MVAVPSDPDNDAGKTYNAGGKGGSGASGRGGAGGRAGAGRGGAAASGGSSGSAGESGSAGSAGSGGDAAPSCGLPADAPPSTGNFVALHSDCGDYIGQGKNYLYTHDNALLEVTVRNDHVEVYVFGDESWNGNFAGKMSDPHLLVGEYTDLKGWPFHVEADGGLSWSGESRTCSNLTGSMEVTAIEFDGDVISALEMSFEQDCTDALLRGQIRWHASDVTPPKGPVQPPPTDLWKPAAGATPSTPRYIYLQSSEGDGIGRGKTHSYTQANAELGIETSDGRISVSVVGDEYWDGEFSVARGTQQLQVGYYADLVGYNPARGGLHWSGEHLGCNDLRGWYVVDSVSYVSNVLNAIDLRFEQVCTGSTGPLHGAIHWSASDSTMPAGPVNPPPNDLWAPAGGATPANGNYLYIQSGAGDEVGQGQTSTVTISASEITSAMRKISVSTEDWTGSFFAMYTLSQIQPGYYPDVQHAPDHNPAKGGLDWRGKAHVCSDLASAWFAVDNVTYNGEVVTALDLRFEQHCLGSPAALHGKIHLAP